MRSLVSVLVLCVLVCACSLPPRKPTPAADGVPAAAPAASKGATRYNVETAESEIRVLVYRGGPLARLGHNHVIVLRPQRGWVQSTSAITGSSLQLEVPLAMAQVDDAAMRRAEGADFPGEIPDDARAGTAKNMLGEALLDAAHHPLMIIRSTAISAKGEGFGAELLVSLAGREIPLHAQFTLERSADRLIARGEFKLLQSQLGLKPFSVMMGALQVQDQIGIKFKISALRQ